MVAMQMQLQRSSFTSTLRVNGAQAKRPLAAARVVCSAENKDASKQLGTAAAAAALALTFGLTAVDAAYADVAGLTPCSESKAFAKRKKNEVKGLNKRMKQYEDGSAPALALNATIEKTNKRFDNYARQDPGLALRYGHTGDVLVPTVGFLYVAGWIGYSGTKYVQEVKNDKKPTDKEIIIDVPLAWKLLWAGLGWPIAAVAELRNGTLLEDDDKITVSPR